MTSRPAGPRLYATTAAVTSAFNMGHFVIVRLHRVGQRLELEAAC